MKRNRKMVLALPASALAATVGWMLWAGRAPAAPAPAPTVSAEQPAAPAPADIARHADPAKLREVEQIVAEKNREASKERQAFENAGWTIVTTTPPDQRVVGYDPSLVKAGREHELKMQMLSTVPSPEQAKKVAEIARIAKDESTRYAAVEALGHLNAPEATQALYDLLVNGGLDPNDQARQQIAPLLRPTALDDDMAGKIALLLDSPSLSPIEKEQIAFTLALIGLRDGT
jgi:HEAT repeat protein